jgi:hypothetical protein
MTIQTLAHSQVSWLAPDYHELQLQVAAWSSVDSCHDVIAAVILATCWCFAVLVPSLYESKGQEVSCPEDKVGLYVVVKDEQVFIDIPENSMVVQVSWAQRYTAAQWQSQNGPCCSSRLHGQHHRTVLVWTSVPMSTVHHATDSRHGLGTFYLLSSELCER